MGLLNKKYNYDPGMSAGAQAEPSIGERLLNQVGMNLLGVDVIGLGRRKQLQDQQRQFLGEFAKALQPQYQDGPAPVVSLDPNEDTAANYQYQPPVRTSDGLNINSPDLPSLALRAQALGVPISQVLDVMKAQQPDVNYDRGFGYNKKTGGAMGAFHPELDKGMTLGAGGEVSNLPGYVRSAADAAGAVAGAQEGAKAALDVIPIDMGDGTTQQVPRDLAAKIIAQHLLGGAAAGGGGGATGGFGRTRSPEATSAAKIRGDAQATSQVSLPTDLNAVDSAITTATRLRDHPELNHRTGMWSVLPAIPGTPGASFDAYKKQLLGQTFLDAYNTLRGGGQITEVEGRKATDAKVRMDAAQTPEDFKAALNDFIGAMQRGRAILQQKAGVPGQSLPSTPRTSGKGWTIRQVN
jgi:hypothetical protein